MPKSHPARTRMIDGVLHRWRRDRWVPIPEEWRGKVAHPQSIRKRPSKARGGKRDRKGIKHDGRHGPAPRFGRRGFGGPTIEEFLDD